MPPKLKLSYAREYRIQNTKNASQMFLEHHETKMRRIHGTRYSKQGEEEARQAKETGGRKEKKEGSKRGEKKDGGRDKESARNGHKMENK